MALTRCAAIEAARHNVRVNAVAPSLAMHPFLAKVTTEELLAELTTKEAFGRAAEPWEVANVIVFLASDLAQLPDRRGALRQQPAPVVGRAEGWHRVIDTSARSAVLARPRALTTLKLKIYARNPGADAQ